MNHSWPWFPYCFDCFMQQTDKGSESKCGTTKGKALPYYHRLSKCTYTETS